MLGMLRASAASVADMAAGQAERLGKSLRELGQATRDGDVNKILKVINGPEGLIALADDLQATYKTLRATLLQLLKKA